MYLILLLFFLFWLDTSNIIILCILFFLGTDSVLFIKQIGIEIVHIFIRKVNGRSYYFRKYMFTTIWLYKLFIPIGYVIFIVWIIYFTFILIYIIRQILLRFFIAIFLIMIDIGVNTDTPGQMTFILIIFFKRIILIIPNIVTPS